MRPPVTRPGALSCPSHCSGRLPPPRQHGAHDGSESVQELTRRLAELAVDVDDDDNDLAWTIQLTSVNTVVDAATKQLHADEVAAWESARNLWRTMLDLGYALTDEGHNEIGAIRRQDRDSGEPAWRGTVRMVMNPV